MRTTTRDRLSPDERQALIERLHLSRNDATMENLLALLDDEIHNCRDLLERCSPDDVRGLQGKLVGLRGIYKVITVAPVQKNPEQVDRKPYRPTDRGGY